MTDDELYDSFEVPRYIDMADARHTAAWIRERSEPDDNILIRGYDAELYALAKRRYRGRFFWTAALTDPRRAYRREEWLAEDLDAIIRDPPRYVVAYPCPDSYLDSASWFEGMGYRVKAAFGSYIILGRE
jgi:hypothetical protein